MTLRPSTAPQRVPLPSPPATSLPALVDPESHSLRATSPTVTRFLASAETNPLFESRPASPESRSALPVHTVCPGRRVSRPHPPPVPGTHSMTLRPSTAPQRVPLPSPPATSLPALVDPESDSLRATSPTVTRFLAPAETDPLFESRPASPESRSALPVRTVCPGRRVSRPRPPPVPGTHSMTLRPSTAPQRVPLPSPPESSLPDGPDPESDSLRAASHAVTRFLDNPVTDPLFKSTAASALVAELVDFATPCRLDYATSLVAESASASVCPPSVGGECALGTNILEDRQEEFVCFAAAVPHLVFMLLAPEGDPDAPDIPTPRSYAEAIEGPYSSQWQAAMDAEMAS
ncbi:unnamed protein product [Closterium sp. NIES-53]